MAREFAQIKLSIWADDDWRDLSPDARYLYLTLLTSPTLTHCGTADWRPARIAALNGQSIQTVLEAGAELVESLHLVIDEETEEVLIRSFIRNDGLMKQPRMAVSMANAHAALASKGIRGVIVHELKRLREDFPGLGGWEKDKATLLLGLESVDPKDFPLGTGPFGGSFGGHFGPGLGETQRSVSGSPTPSPAPSPAPSRLTPRKADASASQIEGPDFDAWWVEYPRKKGKGQARPAYVRARKKADADTILAATIEQAAIWSAAGTEMRFIPMPSTWLNGERWDDEVAEPKKVANETEWWLR